MAYNGNNKYISNITTHSENSQSFLVKKKKNITILPPSGHDERPIIHRRPTQEDWTTGRGTAFKPIQDSQSHNRDIFICPTRWTKQNKK